MAYDNENNQWVEDPIHTERRIGRIDIAEEFYKNDTKTLFKLFSLLIPIKVDFDYSKLTFTVVGYAGQFDPVALGNHIPYYNVIVHKNNPKIPEEIEIEFKKA